MGRLTRGEAAVRIALPAFVLAVLAGCASPALGPGPGPAALGASPADTFVWSGCRGAQLEVDGPTALYPPNAPGGWEPSRYPLLLLRVVLLECARVSWGPFERGPVAIAQEWRTDLAPPPGCLDGDSDGTALLESVWFSDPEVARFAQENGLPAAAMESSVAPSASGEEWSWGPAGAERSSAQVPAPLGPGNATREAVRRLLWADGPGVGAMDLRTSSSTAMLGTSAAAGFLQPPTLYGRANPSSAFAGRGSPFAEVEASGSLQRFGDPSCAQPR